MQPKAKKNKSTVLTKSTLTARLNGVAFHQHSSASCEVSLRAGINFACFSFIFYLIRNHHHLFQDIHTLTLIPQKMSHQSAMMMASITRVNIDSISVRFVIRKRLFGSLFISAAGNMKRRNVVIITGVVGEQINSTSLLGVYVRRFAMASQDLIR